MTKEILLLKCLKVTIEESKNDIKKEIEKNATEYATTHVDMDLGRIKEADMPEAKVKNVALIIAGSIAKATLDAINENLEALDLAIKYLEETEGKEEVDETVEDETTEAEESEEITEEDIMEFIKALATSIR